MLFEKMTLFVNSWFFAAIVVVGMVIAVRFLKYESEEDRRDRIKEERRAQRKAKKDEDGSMDKLIDTVLEKGPAGLAPPRPPEKVIPKPTQTATDTPKAPEEKEVYGLRKWTQTNDEVEIFVGVPKETVKGDIKMVLTDKSLKLTVRGQVALGGELLMPVDKSDFQWQIEDEGAARMVWIQLTKSTPAQKGADWWRTLFKLPDAAPK